MDSILRNENEYIRMYCVDPFFVSAFDTMNHTIKKSNNDIKSEYLVCLIYIVEKTIDETEWYQSDTKTYILERLNVYRKELFSSVSISTTDKKTLLDCLAYFVKNYWRKKYLFALVCDISLLLLEKPLIFKSIEIINQFSSKKRKSEIEQVLFLLCNKIHDFEKKYNPISSLIEQYHLNSDFLSKNEKRIIITANMSAGKSTLINSLICKPIARTSQEVCT